MEERVENVVMLPFMAQGHIIPFLALAQKIEQRKGYTVTFVNTPLNIKKIRSSLPPNSSIRFVEIPFQSSDYGLPPDCENTSDLPPHLVQNLLQASLSLKPGIRKAIHDLVCEQDGYPPLCFICDMFFGWCADMAHEFGISHAIYFTTNLFSIGCYFSLSINLPHHRNKECSEFLLPDFLPSKNIHVTQISESLKAVDNAQFISMYLKNLQQECMNFDGALINTLEYFDKEGLAFFRRKFSKPFWSIGPVILPSGSGSNRAGNEDAIAPEVCKGWLDSKPPNSVLYICFGSQNTLSSSAMLQLAMALEASAKNFIWVVRPPSGLDINSAFEAKECLPEGFEDRIKASGKGLLVHKWAPQTEILSHQSTSAFLSHCGWNSVLEALSYGVPILAWPMGADQFYNVKLLDEELGLCLEVARGRDPEVRHEEILKKIEILMNDTEMSQKLRRKTCEAKEMIKNALRDEEGFKGISVQAMDDFFDAAMQRRQKSGVNSST